MTKTKLFFDVDGVFNALPWKHTDLVGETGWQTWEKVKVNGFTITYSPELVAAVNTIAARDDVEVHWLTTWCDKAASMIAPALGINGVDWPVIGTDADVDHKSLHRWWKFDLLRTELFEDESPVVWVDDDMLSAAAQVFNLYSWSNERADLLQICPDIELGITRAHIEEIVKFLDDVHADSSVV